MDTTIFSPLVQDIAPVVLGKSRVWLVPQVPQLTLQPQQKPGLGEGTRSQTS